MHKDQQQTTPGRLNGRNVRRTAVFRVVNPNVRGRRSSADEWRRNKAEGSQTKDWRPRVALLGRSGALDRSEGISVGRITRTNINKRNRECVKECRGKTMKWNTRMCRIGLACTSTALEECPLTPNQTFDRSTDRSPLNHFEVRPHVSRSPSFAAASRAFATRSSAPSRCPPARIACISSPRNIWSVGLIAATRARAGGRAKERR